MPPDIKPESIKKIAVLRANALGDFIFILPALQALRETFPRAEIVLLGKQWHTSFVPGRISTIDRIVVVPPYPGVGADETVSRDSPEINDFFYAMQQERFDLAFQMHGGGGNSNPFVERLGARISIGLQAQDAPALSINIPYVFYHNEVLRYLEVVRSVGATTAGIIPHVQVTDADRKEAAAIMTATTSSRPYIVIHPGASDSRRHWPAEKFAAVAGQLIDRGYEIFVTGTSAEAVVVTEVVRHEPRAIDLCDKISLGGLTALLAGAELTVSNDTGPLHLASAVGGKTVGIYWIGNMLTASQMQRARHRPLISWTTACPVCSTPCVDDYQTNKRYCEHQVSFIADISVERVLEEAMALLEA